MTLQSREDPTTARAFTEAPEATEADGVGSMDTWFLEVRLELDI